MNPTLWAKVSNGARAVVYSARARAAWSVLLMTLPAAWAVGAAGAPRDCTAGPAADASPAARGPAVFSRQSPFAQQLLSAHNRYRCLHGVPPLQWNDQVADYAQRWLEKAGFAHSDSFNSPLGPMGENLFATTGLLFADDAVAGWYRESRGYDYRREAPPGTGHFTAMIWKGARYLGCGSVRGAVSCNYWAGPGIDDCAVPNTQGCFTQQVLPVSRDAHSCP